MSNFDSFRAWVSDCIKRSFFESKEVRRQQLAELRAAAPLRRGNLTFLVLPSLSRTIHERVDEQTFFALGPDQFLSNFGGR
jgi:hypothetical protein